MHTSPRIRNLFHIMGSIIACTGVVLQWVSIMQKSQANVGTTLIQFLSYFTVLTNILVAICFLSLWLGEQRSWGRFFQRYSTLTAVNVYILIVSLVYNIVLRNIWSPQGIALIADILQHTIVPLFFLIYWAFVAVRERIPYSKAGVWLIYPVAYLAYTLIRGTWTQAYPYPFLDVVKLGYGKALLNCAMVGGIFYTLSLLFIWASHKRSSVPDAINPHQKYS